MRQLYSAVGLCILAVSMAGCSGGQPEPTETVISMPASPAPTSSGPESAPAAADGATSTAGPDGVRPTATDIPGASASADPSAHCVIVAGGVTTAMLAPLSLRSEADPDELVALRQQILDLRAKVPADLRDDFTTLAHSVEAPPRGSGQFDERSFRQAMVPVQDWLGRHCSRT